MRGMLLSALVLFSLSAVGQSATGRFDGTWDTTVTCDSKGETLGYTWHFFSTVTDNVLRGERGTPGQQAYMAFDGKIGDDGKAKLTASGTTGATQYTHGLFKSEGEAYSYEVKSEFTPTEGKGERSTGLGFVGRPCHYRWVKRADSDGIPKRFF